ncbi:MAG: hypothetical protein ACJ76P_10525 [Actinomycetota bacterium]
MSGRRLVGWLVLAGVLVGGLVTGTSALLGRSDCPDSEAPGLSLQSCEGLVRSLAVRTGVAAGIATIFVLLLVAGLMRTSQRMEEDRHADAIERYREGRLNE